MAYCEECGAKLAEDALFCEECGAKVSVIPAVEKQPMESSNSLDGFGVFSGNDKKASWKACWKAAAENAAGEELGIIMTSDATLASQLSVDADVIHHLVGEYIQSALRRGVHYYYLDVSDNVIANVNGEDVEEVVLLLNTIVNVARPKYLFILGNDEVINVACWENQSCDGDDDVLSDLPYTFLNTISPWEGLDYNCDEAIRVGRLPSTDGEFAQFRAYFENAADGIGHIDNVRPYGLSALVWEDESNNEYSAISSKNVKTSPDVTVEYAEHQIGKSNANLMFFNLHGSDETEYWYGQQGGTYPEAVSPEVFDAYPTPFFLGVEACYGARYIGLETCESIVKTVMANKCLALLGSSKIAYGTSEPDGTCADIVIGTFVKQIAKGETAGDAHIDGLKKLMSESDMDDSDVKTLAEFSLYGDPSACMGKNKNLGVMKGFMKKLGGVSKGIHIPIPNVRKASKLCLAEVDAKIERCVDDFVSEKLMPVLKQKGLAIGQKTFRMQNRNMNQKVYSVEMNHILQIAKVYFDNSGKIHKALLSK